MENIALRKLSEYIRKNCLLFNYKEEKSDKSYLFEEDDFSLMIKNYENYQILEALLFSKKILDGLKLEYFIYVSKELNWIIKYLDEYHIEYKVLDLSESFEFINKEGSLLSYGATLSKNFNLMIFLNEIISTLNNLGRPLDKEEGLHVIIHSKDPFEALKISKILRTSGMKCDINIAQNALFEIYLSDLDAIVESKNDKVHLNKEDLVPFMLSKINQKNNKCNTCKTKE